MADILHRIVIEASPEKVYNALTEQEGLSAWWTKTRTEGKIGALATFFFGPNDEHQVVMEITDMQKNAFVSWKCVEGPWVNTGAFKFMIEPDERGSALKFSHSDWPEADEFYMHCNSKWGFFFTVSLKNYLETGKGVPSPNDPDI